MINSLLPAEGVLPENLEHASIVTKAPHHVLVIDDEASVCDVLRSYLTRRQYRVTTASDVADAFVILRSQTISLAIVDVVLGDADGIEVIGDLKTMFPELPVIGVSGLGFDQTLSQQVLARGGSGFVSKCAPLEELRSAIESALACQSRSAPMPSQNVDRRVYHKKGRVHPSANCAETVKGVRAFAPEPSKPFGSVSERGKQAVNSSLAALLLQTTGGVMCIDEPPPVANPSKRANSQNQHSDGGTSDPEVKTDVVISCEIPAEPAAIAELTAITSEGTRMKPVTEVYLRMLAVFDPNLANTAMRAVVLCESLADFVKLPDRERQDLLWAAALHDLGLTKFDRGAFHRWLRNPDGCSKIEAAQFQQHPAYSQEMLGCYPAFKIAGEIVCAHHERWDGNGYPNKLGMEAIPLTARLLSVAIAYCSEHTPNPRSVAAFQAEANGGFDSRAVEALAQVISQKGLPKGERELTSSELRLGMVLGQDIYDLKQIMVVGKGSELTMSTLGRVVRLMQNGQSDSRILIVR
jgi:response regulator RpfG family c-di-GMP phosphodiesterase